MFALPKGSRFVVVVMSRGLLAGTSQLAAAKTWSQEHPRRAEVNARFNLRNWRINQELKQGKISVGADALHDQDQFVRKQERFDASHNGRHIRGAEQKALNQQENGVSGKIP
jgi:hypothetical protein